MNVFVAMPGRWDNKEKGIWPISKCEPISHSLPLFNYHVGHLWLDFLITKKVSELLWDTKRAYDRHAHVVDWVMQLCLCSDFRGRKSY